MLDMHRENACQAADVHARGPFKSPDGMGDG